jgi:putative ABC transport system permease protein
MLGYNVRIAAKSLRRNPVLTTLLIGAIALGICVSTTFIALRHVFEKDPIPSNSKNLFYVRLDNWDPTRAYIPEDPKSMPTQITYRDMRGLMESKIPTRQTGTFNSRMFIYPDPKMARPYKERVRLVFSDFFPMFAVPFQYGGPWDKAADAKPESVIVIDQANNQKLFGGGNSVGRTVRIEDRDFKVIGVLADWQPSYRYYDLTNGPVKVEGLFIPFNLTPIMKINSSGNSDGWKDSGNTFEEGLASEQVWIQFWAELPTAEKQREYRDWVNHYVMDQKKLGRFQRPLHTEVLSMKQLFEIMNVVPSSVRSMSVVSILFLVVCSLNLVGLLLGKFLARVPEVSVRRALGASRMQIFWQHVVECELIGVAGGLLGMSLSVVLLRVLNKVMNSSVGNTISGIALDGEMVLVAIFLSLVAGLLAGVYPSWRVCTVAPAMQLKVQ